MKSLVAQLIFYTVIIVVCVSYIGYRRGIENDAKLACVAQGKAPVVLEGFFRNKIVCASYAKAI